MSKTSQILDVKEYLEVHGTITSRECFDKLGATRLSSIIHVLRNSGMKIETELIPHTNKHGNKSHYAKYRYEAG